MKIQLRKPDNSDYEPQDITRLVIYQRCDANELYHSTAFEIKWSEDPDSGDITKGVFPSPRLVGGKYLQLPNRSSLQVALNSQFFANQRL